MTFQFLAPKNMSQQRMFSWASLGVIVFLSAFLWAPSRDGLQGVYLLAFLLPMMAILCTRAPSFSEYGGWPTITGLLYAGFSVLSTLWGEPTDFLFFALQWCVLAAWLCGLCLVVSRREINIEKHFDALVLLGVISILSTFAYNFLFVQPLPAVLPRFVGWNVFRNPNEMGAFCGVIALLAFNIAIQSSCLQRTWIFYFFSLIAILGLFESVSRAALFAFLIMAFVNILLVRPHPKVWLPPIFLFCLAIIATVVYTDVLTSYTSGRGEGFGIRSLIWEEVFERCKEHLVAGVGMSLDTRITISNGMVFNHAHNAWLDTLYRTGLIGLILALIHLLTAFRTSTYDPRLLPLGLWLGYGVICSLFDGRCFFGEIGAKWFFYWIPISLIAALHSNKINKTRRPIITPG